ncbi:MAG: class I SAM-dependent methyltransferase [Desulfuromonadales bacterium]|nr:class I SAM-dependent methyltransferase [Desulfuromonadales bacterium]
MIDCPTCHNDYPMDASSCPQCGFAPEILDGFPCWAPELAYAGDGFDPAAFAGLARNEEGHFWFEARNRLILWALRTYFPQMASFLEIGCGTGFVLRGVARAFPMARLCGSEIFVDGLKFAAQRLPGVSLLQMDARRMPFRDEFDLVGAFDVLEHIDDDGAALAGICAAVKPGGGVILTVPQHRWLWSAVDEYACHKRRYSRESLHRLVEGAGLRIVRSSSFVSLLLPAMLASRWLGGQQGKEAADGSSEFNLPPLLNTLFDRTLAGEAQLIRAGLNLPLGGSRLVVGVKQ